MQTVQDRLPCVEAACLAPNLLDCVYVGDANNVCHHYIYVGPQFRSGSRFVFPTRRH